METSRGYFVETSRGDAAAATWIYFVETSRGRSVWTGARRSYCGGSIPVIEQCKNISKAYGIPFGHESFKW